MTTLADSPLPLSPDRPARPADVPASDFPTVELVLPVHNEERVLESSVRTLRHHMRQTLNCAFQITIADNASTDGTLACARALAAELPDVQVLRLEQKGRGRALKVAWSASRAEVVGYMDIDLSTDLAHLAGLLAPLLENRTDIAIGSRLAPGAEVTRGLKREAISRAYNILLRGLLRIGVSDAQCGFKAARREAIAPLLNQVADDGWFFDTELLFLARQSRLAIHEVPVAWVDDPESSVDIIDTAIEDLKGIARLRRGQSVVRPALPRPTADVAGLHGI